MRVAVVGTGYVGLVSGACLAEKGHQVICVDNDPAKVAAITQGRSPIHEAGLQELINRHRGTALRATGDLADAVRSSDLTLIAVGTPARDGRIDTSYVEQAAREIGAALRGVGHFHAVVVKSTVVPGTTDGVVRATLEQASGKSTGEQLGLGMNPEFLTEGQAVSDFMQPDRIVLGAADPRTLAMLRELYAGFADVPVVATNNATAEMIKYASNALLATMISFSNEFARLSAAVGGVDAMDVMRGVHMSAYLTTRTGACGDVVAPITAFLQPGCGFGGSCLPKDVTAIVAQGNEFGVDMPLLRSVLEINRGQPGEVLRLIQRQVPDLSGKHVLVLGLAFKPDTDDLRESPAFPIVRLLLDAGAVVSAYDPLVRESDHPGLRGVILEKDLDSAIKGAEVLVLVTKWSEFADLAERLRRLGVSPLVVDGRRFLDRALFQRYEGIGLQ